MVRLRGSALRSADGTTWKRLKEGDLVAPGCVLRTRDGRDVFLDLVLGESLRSQGLVGERRVVNAVRLWGGSVLKIDHLKAPKGRDRPLEVRLDLLEGRMLSYVKRCVPGGDYVVTVTNAIAVPEGNTWYEITARGGVTVWKGAVSLSPRDNGVTKRIVASHRLDPETGLVVETPASEPAPATAWIPPAPRQWPPWLSRSFLPHARLSMEENPPHLMD